MRAEILAVGTELLMGQIANTNAQYISARLPDVGVGVYYHSVVGDNPKRLKECLLTALERTDVVIMTGGLGPTKDDLTKETTAEIMGKKLVIHEDSFKRLKNRFERTGRKMTENNMKQAYLPEGCIVIENNRGTAPGCIIESGGKAVIMLPGPPSEMKPMFEDTVIPYFSKKAEFLIYSRFMRIFGIGESAVEDKIIDIVENQTNPTIASYVKEGEVTLRVSAKCANGENPDGLLMPMIDEVKKRLGNAVYSIDNKELHEVVGALLIKHGITVSVAESCTGGLVAAKFTDIPGISKVLNRGIVSYSNQAKIENLHVNPQTLEKYGAVSSQTAEEMAEGMLEVAGTDVAVAITGIAGPDGGTEEKPVGLVYIALADKNGVKSKELRLLGIRSRIRSVTVLNVFDMIRYYILEKYGV